MYLPIVKFPYLDAGGAGTADGGNAGAVGETGNGIEAGGVGETGDEGEAGGVGDTGDEGEAGGVGDTGGGGLSTGATAGIAVGVTVILTCGEVHIFTNT